MEGAARPRDDNTAEWFASPAAAEEVEMLRQWVAGLSTELARARDERDQAREEAARLRAELDRARAATDAGPRSEPPAAPTASAPADRQGPPGGAASPPGVGRPAEDTAAAAPPKPAAPEPAADPRGAAGEPETPPDEAPPARPGAGRRGPLAAAAAALRRLGLPLAVVAIVVCLLVGVGPLVLPYKLQVVRGDSMAPALPHGTLVLAWPVEATEVWPDNVIVFQSPTDRTRTITHRVVGVTLRPEGVTIQTRGDANPTVDPWVVRPGDLRGRVIAALPLLGYPLLGLQSVAVAAFWGLPIVGLGLIAAGIRVLVWPG